MQYEGMAFNNMDPLLLKLHLFKIATYIITVTVSFTSQTELWTPIHVTCLATPLFITFTEAVLTNSMTRTPLGTVLYCVVSNKTFKAVVEVTIKIDKHLQRKMFLQTVIIECGFL